MATIGMILLHATAFLPSVFVFVGCVIYLQRTRSTLGYVLVASQLLAVLATGTQVAISVACHRSLDSGGGAAFALFCTQIVMTAASLTFATCLLLLIARLPVRRRADSHADADTPASPGAGHEPDRMPLPGAAEPPREPEAASPPESGLSLLRRSAATFPVLVILALPFLLCLYGRSCLQAFDLTDYRDLVESHAILLFALVPAALVCVAEALLLKLFRPSSLSWFLLLEIPAGLGLVLLGLFGLLANALSGMSRAMGT